MAKRIHNTVLIAILSLPLLVAAFGCEKNVSLTLPENFPKQTSFYTDINNDNIPEKGFIKNGTAYIYSNKELIFESDPSLSVKEIFTGDFNNDNQADFALSLWKTGNYGPAKPFWVEENDNSYKMHLFLYTYEREKIRALWHSSNLPKINLITKFQDNYLLVLEKDYKSPTFSLAKWQWNGWGFELVKRISL